MQQTHWIAGLMVGLLLALPSSVQAQSWQTRSLTIAMKGGESTEVTDLYWVIDCRSQLKSSPTATILSGPAGVTVEVKEAEVVPRLQQCSRPVKGGKLVLKAGNIEGESTTTMTLRVDYDTKDGPRQIGYNINLSLFPAQ